MKPGDVEVIVEVTLKTASSIFVHQGGPTAELRLADVEVFEGDPAPGLASVWLPRAAPAEHGFTYECEDVA